MTPRRSLVRTNLIQYTGGLALTLLGLALTLLLSAQPALAHGGGAPQLTNATAGPYRVSVWTEPDPARVGELHVTVAVVEAPEPGASSRDGGDLVLDAAVLVRVEPVDRSGETLIAMATRDNAVNKLFYEADFDLPAEGGWRVEIQVDGPAGAGSTAFDVDALPPSTLNNLFGLGWPLWAGLGLTLLVAGWWSTMARDRNNEVRHA